MTDMSGMKQSLQTRVVKEQFYTVCLLESVLVRHSSYSLICTLVSYRQYVLTFIYVHLSNLCITNGILHICIVLISIIVAQSIYTYLA